MTFDAALGPGVYRWHSEEPADDVERAVLAAGRRFGLLTGVATTSDLHTRLADVLGFPDHYGRNLDALADCLRDLASPADRRRWVLLWDDWADLDAAEPRVARIARQLLGDRLTLVLRGPGPALAVPDLGEADPPPRR